MRKKVTFEQMRRHFNLNNNTLRFHLIKLKKGHAIRQTKSRGLYKITETGEFMLRKIKILLPKIIKLVESKQIGVK